MKKIIVIALAVVLALGAVALTACGKEETQTGKCWYASQYGNYGCMVEVSVKNGVITNVKLLSDTEAAAADATWGGAHRTSDSRGTWDKDAAEAKYDAYLASFVNKKVEDIKAIKVLPEGKVNADIASGALETSNYSPVQLFGGSDTWVIAGATQSSARIVVAIQDALSKLEA